MGAAASSFNSSPLLNEAQAMELAGDVWNLQQFKQFSNKDGMVGLAQFKAYCANACLTDEEREYEKFKDELTEICYSKQGSSCFSAAGRGALKGLENQGATCFRPRQFGIISQLNHAEEGPPSGISC